MDILPNSHSDPVGKSPEVVRSVSTEPMSPPGTPPVATKDTQLVDSGLYFNLIDGKSLFIPACCFEQSEVLLEMLKKQESHLYIPFCQDVASKFVSFCVNLFHNKEITPEFEREFLDIHMELLLNLVYFSNEMKAVTFKKFVTKPLIRILKTATVSEIQHIFDLQHSALESPLLDEIQSENDKLLDLLTLE
ncbi:hypothetical protein PCE1_004187 [Barthelona sp. PCE]